jgi:DNA-binding beta-propeller fold protein YncE
MKTGKRAWLAHGIPAILFALPLAAADRPAGKEQHLLYVASPGIRNYEEYGGVGVLVYDIDAGYKFVRRIPTWETPAGQKPENVKGIAASARTGRVYVSTINRMMSLDAVTGKKYWDKTYQGGCDRMAISPDGRILYVPQLEGPLWHVVNAMNGEVIASIETRSASHNTIFSLDGTRVFLAGLKSPVLSVASARTHKVESTAGPFSAPIRPFTVNGSNTFCFVNVNGLLGFEVGDLRTGKKLHRVEVEGFQQGKVKRHGCPSHGIALTPDEKELWVVDGANYYVHVFDASVMPPKQMSSIKLRDSPGWISFSLDGKFAYSSTGEIIDQASKKVVATLQDETGRQVQSEKMLDLVIANGKVARAGDQFGVGMKR